MGCGASSHTISPVGTVDEQQKETATTCEDPLYSTAEPSSPRGVQRRYQSESEDPRNAASSPRDVELIVGERYTHTSGGSRRALPTEHESLLIASAIRREFLQSCERQDLADLRRHEESTLRASLTTPFTARSRPLASFSALMQTPTLSSSLQHASSCNSSLSGAGDGIGRSNASVFDLLNSDDDNDENEESPRRRRHAHLDESHRHPDTPLPFALAPFSPLLPGQVESVPCGRAEDEDQVAIALALGFSPGRAPLPTHKGGHGPLPVFDQQLMENGSDSPSSRPFRSRSSSSSLSLAAAVAYRPWVMRRDGGSRSAEQRCLTPLESLQEKLLHHAQHHGAMPSSPAAVARPVPHTSPRTTTTFECTERGGPVPGLSVPLASPSSALIQMLCLDESADPTNY